MNIFRLKEQHNCENFLVLAFKSMQLQLLLTVGNSVKIKFVKRTFVSVHPNNIAHMNAVDIFTKREVIKKQYTLQLLKINSFKANTAVHERMFLEVF